MTEFTCAYCERLGCLCTTDWDFEDGDIKPTGGQYWLCDAHRDMAKVWYPDGTSESTKTYFDRKARR